MCIKLKNRPIDVFLYGFQYESAKKEEKRKMYKAAMEKEENLGIFFQLVESFLANAPQLLLQLYILTVNASTSNFNESECILFFIDCSQ